MKYKNIKVKEINPVVYLGDEFVNNNWKENQRIFKEKIKDLNFKVEFGFECPIDDLIVVQIDYDDDFEPLAKESTIDNIFSVTNELLKVFKESVKINLYLDDFLEEGNSIDLTIAEFIIWLTEELAKHEGIFPLESDDDDWLSYL